MLQLGARYYWPEIGRFISQDPIGEGSNWYAYVGNNPVVRIDPSGEVLTLAGLIWLGVETGLTGAAVGNAIAAGIYAAGCVDCLKGANKLICLAQQEFLTPSGPDNLPNVEGYCTWKREAKPGRECKEVCDQALDRTAQAAFWATLRLARWARCPRARNTWD